MNLSYKTHIESLLLNGISVQVESIENLDHAIDELCTKPEFQFLSEQELFNRCPYFGKIWPSAHALALHMSRMGNWLQSKQILELGCGLAVPSLVCAKLGAHVIASDFHPDVPDFLKRNKTINHIRSEQLHYMEWSWQEPLPLQNHPSFDFIIASDVLYEAHHPLSLANALDSLSTKKTQIILTDPGRTHVQNFAEEMKRLGFQFEMMIGAGEIFILNFSR